MWGSKETNPLLAKFLAAKIRQSAEKWSSPHPRCKWLQKGQALNLGQVGTMLVCNPPEMPGFSGFHLILEFIHSPCYS